jgi:soluble lytic murein transglycosylase-like protein
LQTAQGMGFNGDVSELLDPATNLAYGCQFLSYVYTGAPDSTASAYNGGSALGDGTYTDQSYVTQVVNYYNEFSGASGGSGAGATAAGIAVVVAGVLGLWALGRL